MKFGISCDANWETRVDQLTDILNKTRYTDLFEYKNYGDGLNEIFVVLMCRDPRLKFKQRIRCARKEKILYMDIMLDYHQMCQADEKTRVKIVTEKLAGEITRILRKYNFANFDEIGFIKDLKDWLEAVV